MLSARWFGLFSLLLVLGCETPLENYAYDRALDAMDAVPISFGAGRGLEAHVRVTRFFGVGAGWDEATRYGVDERRFGPLWDECEMAFPLIQYERWQKYRPNMGDWHSVERWPGGNHEDPMVRGNSYLFAPRIAAESQFWPPPFSPAWQCTEGSIWDVANVEAGLFAGVVGVRAAVSPLQMFDFLAGIFTWDPACDDRCGDVETFPDQHIAEDGPSGPYVDCGRCDDPNDQTPHPHQ